MNFTHKSIQCNYNNIQIKKLTSRIQNNIPLYYDNIIMIIVMFVLMLIFIRYPLFVLYPRCPWGYVHESIEFLASACAMEIWYWSWLLCFCQ